MSHHIRVMPPDKGGARPYKIYKRGVLKLCYMFPGTPHLLQGCKGGQVWEMKEFWGE